MSIHKMTIRSLAIFVTVLALGAATTVTAATEYVNPDGVCGGNSPCYTTIQAAIDAPTTLPGDTIKVPPATYHESVNIDKSLTLQGAQAGVDARTRSGAESVIDNACSPVQINSDNVTLDGFTVQGSTMADPCTIVGIWMNSAVGAQILNNIVQNNISGIELDNSGATPAKVQFNLIQNNNNPGPGSGNGIETDFGLVNATIDNNKFIGQTSSSIVFEAPTSSVTISNNTLDAGIAMFISTGISITGNTSIGNTADGTIYLGGGDSSVTISSNVLENGIEGVVIEDPFSIGPNSNVTVSSNCIAGNSMNGLRVAHLGYAGTAKSLNATNNWWGAASGPKYNGAGPGTGDNIDDPDGVVNYTPFNTSAGSCPPSCAPVTSCVTGGFNGTSIPTSRYLWFTANMKASGISSTGATINFTNSVISITSNNGNFTYPTRDGKIVFSPSATCATTTFNGTQWVTTVPVSGSDVVLLSALGIKPTVDLKGAKIKWCASFTANKSGISVNWKAGTAVYISDMTEPNYNTLGVKPTHTNACLYNNSDHAATPENEKKYLVAGAAGGGGSNYTGSWSSTSGLKVCP